MTSIRNKAKLSKPVSNVPDAEKKKNVLTAKNASVIRMANLPHNYHIDSIALFVLSTDDVISNSVVSITNDNTDGPNSVNDKKMGPSVNEICETCGSVFMECLGHYGHINLPFPIINKLFIKQLIYVLTSICWECARPYITTLDIENNKFNEDPYMLKKIAKWSTSKVCRRLPDDGCMKCTSCVRKIASKASKDAGEIKYTIGKSDEQTLETTQIIDILKAISKADLKLLGFDERTHPLNYILRNILIRPPCTRPNLVSTGGKLQKDMITEVYLKLMSNIVKYNSLINPTTSDLHNSVESIKKNLNELFYGETNNPGLLPPLKGKTGLIRKDMMGSQAFNTGRSVASNNPDLPYGWINIPRSMANKVEVPVIVTLENMAQSKEFFNNKLVSNVKPYNGNFKGIKVSASNIKNLYVGDVIYRNLIDDDLIIVNRQPTLHKWGIMGFNVKLWDNETIGAHPAYTAAFNLDFDGDEIFVIIPKSLDALTDVLNVMHVTKNILSSTNNTAYGLIQDAIASFYLLSKPEVKILPETFQEIIEHNQLENMADFEKRLAKHGVEKYSGRGLVSTLYPKDFYYNYNGVLIKDGILISGLLMKKHVGAGTHSIIKMLALRDQKIVPRYINAASFLTNRYLKDHPITMGVKDCMIFDYKSPEEKAKIDLEIKKLEGGNPEEIKKLKESKLSTVEKLNNQVKRIIHDVELLEDAKINASNAEIERLEGEIKTKLSTAKQLGIDLVNDQLSDDYLAVAIKAGVKGNEVNAASIAGMIAQQLVNGVRPEVLKFLIENENDIFGRGFVLSSYSGTRREDGKYEGLSVLESMITSAATRIALAGTSIQTAQVGAIQRTLNKLMQGLVLMDNGAVMFNNKYIVQSNNMLNPGNLIKMDKSAPTFIDIAQTAGYLNTKYGF